PGLRPGRQRHRGRRRLRPLPLLLRQRPALAGRPGRRPAGGPGRAPRWAPCALEHFHASGYACIIVGRRSVILPGPPPSRPVPSAGYGPGTGITYSCGIFARMYYADGTPRGNQFRIATTADLTSNVVSVAMNPAGNFVVAWGSVSDIYSTDPDVVYAQRFNAA